MSSRLVLLVTLAPIAFLGCVGDSPAGANVIPIEGRWSFAAEMSGGGQSCSQTATTLVIQRDGSTFSGTITGGIWSCTDGAWNFLRGGHPGAPIWNRRPSVYDAPGFSLGVSRDVACRRHATEPQVRPEADERSE